MISFPVIFVSPDFVLLLCSYPRAFRMSICFTRCIICLPAMRKTRILRNRRSANSDCQCDRGYPLYEFSSCYRSMPGLSVFLLEFVLLRSAVLLSLPRCFRTIAFHGRPSKMSMEFRSSAIEAQDYKFTSHVRGPDALFAIHFSAQFHIHIGFSNGIPLLG